MRKEKEREKMQGRRYDFGGRKASERKGSSRGVDCK